jgi:hypothetical protein
MGGRSKFNPEKYLVEEGLLFRQTDNKNQLDGAEVVAEKVQVGKIY